MRSIKRDLEEQRSALNRSIKSLNTSRDVDQGREIVKNPYGAASITLDEEIAAALADGRARQLKEVAAALDDFDAGRYGICRECGEPIAKARLR